MGPDQQKKYFHAIGFTLLELLVAVAITAVLAGLMLTVTNKVLQLWQRIQGRQAQLAAARQVLVLLERDLQAASLQTDGACRLALDILDNPTALANHGWLFSSGPMKPGQGGSLRPLVGPDADGNYALREARFGLSGVWLRLMTTNVESGGSLPTVVAWQLVRRPVTGDPVESNPAPVRYALYRSAVSNRETFSNGPDVLFAAYASSTNTPTSALSTAYRQSRNVMNPSHANLIAANVVDFGCWLYVREATGALRRIYPADATDLVHHALGNGATDDVRNPAVVDVLLRILTEEGANQVAAMENGQIARPAEFSSDAEWWWRVVEAHSVVVTRRIEIKGEGR